ncbi:MAG: ABC transporter permease [Planctomycetota bacterium]
MKRVLQVARREFASTALTKGFLFGAIILPAIMAAAIPGIGWLAAKAEEDAPVVEGTIALIDNSGGGEQLTDRISFRLQAEDFAAIDPTNPLEAVGAVTGSESVIELDPLGADADDTEVREALRTQYTEDVNGEVLALAIISEHAITPDGGDYSGFELLHRRKLDDRVISKMRGSIRGAIKDIRFDRAEIDEKQLAILSSVNSDTQEVSETGETTESNPLFGILLPIAMMILLMISVMTGGQYLLTTTIEEKSSRIVEVLLSAVSPMELMFGKILGQMGVGLVLMAIYSGVGAGALLYFSSTTGLLTPQLFVSLAVFFVLAYIMIASLMAAIGAAVNDLREAQSLMTPVMMTFMIPYFLVFPISRAPNSTLSTVLSFIPPVNPFVMVIRMGTNSPPPLWQVLVSALIGAVGAYAFVWFAAKVFRVGLLMYGKPPNFKTLIRWVRMA